MGGSNNNPLTKYVIPGLETVGGGVSEIFAPGNPIGLSLMGSGVGQLAGGAAGGSGGQGIGGSLGSLAGFGAGGLGGAGGSGGLGLPGVSDSALSSMFESINPGAGVGVANTGALPGQGGITGGSGKGTGVAQGAQSIGQGAQSPTFQNLIGKDGLNLQAMLAPKAKSETPPAGSINPSKGPVAGPQLTPPQQKVGKPFGNVYGGQSAEIQKLLQLLKGLK